jgi:hypothetical protein
VRARAPSGPAPKCSRKVRSVRVAKARGDGFDAEIGAQELERGAMARLLEQLRIGGTLRAQLALERSHRTAAVLGKLFE